jgi:hypothetical protein
MRALLNLLLDLIARLRTPKNAWTYMAGTEGTGEYQVIARGPLGRIGYRVLSDRLRIRVEPADSSAADTLAPHFLGWKQPGDGGQFRFSCEVRKLNTDTSIVEDAIAALGDPLEYNQRVVDWRQHVQELTFP